MPEISRTALHALLERLSDPETGFNANLATAAPTYGIAPYVVDWSPTSSVNFMIGQVAADLVEESQGFTYPFTTVDSSGLVDDGRVVSAVFAGLVGLVVEITISNTSEVLPRSFAPLSQAIEDAFFATVNDLEHIGVFLSVLLTYNGRWKLEKTPITFAGQNWRRTLRFTAAIQRITD